MLTPVPELYSRIPIQILLRSLVLDCLEIAEDKFQPSLAIQHFLILVTHPEPSPKNSNHKKVCFMVLLL